MGGFLPAPDGWPARGLAAVLLTAHLGSATPAAAQDPTGASASLDEGGAPAPQGRVGVTHEVGDLLSLGGALRHLDALPALGVGTCSALDLRFGVRPAPGLDVCVSVRNALSASHQEVAPVSLPSDLAHTERSLRAGVT